jgi:hypothetical protein
VDLGQKSDRQKMAMRPNGRLYKIVLPAQTPILSSSAYLGTILIRSPPPANVTPDFQKRKERNTFSKRQIFSTDRSQSMGLQSVPKTMGKTSNFFALNASPYKGCKPRVNLDRFVFSIRILREGPRAVQPGCMHPHTDLLSYTKKSGV